MHHPSSPPRRELDFIAFLILVAVTVLAVWQLRVYDKGCLPGHDCESYIAMVKDIQYSARGFEHHQMRFLPSLLVSFLIKLTSLSIHDAFLVLSSLAFAAASLLSYRYCREEKIGVIPSLVIALLLMTWHWGMLISLKTPYQACDALFYPFFMMMLMSAQRARAVSTLGWSLLGMCCRQSGFVFGFFALGWLLFKNPKKWTHWISFIMLTISYIALNAYYHVGGVLMTLLAPNASTFQWSFIEHFLLESGVITVLFPFIPFLLTGYQQLWTSMRKMPYVWAGGMVVAVQPMLAYHLTGPDNFVRLAMQGVWPIALIYLVAYFKVKQFTKQQIGLLLGYAVLNVGIWSDDKRLGLVAVFSIIWWVALALNKRALLSLNAARS